MEYILDRVNKLLIFFIAYSVIFVVFFKTLPYTLPFVLAFLFAYMLKKPTLYLMKKFKFKESLASLITNIIFFTIVLALLSFIIYSLSSEIISFSKNIQIYLTNNYDKILNYFSKLQEKYNNLDPVILNAIKSYVSNSLSRIMNSSVNIGSSIVSYLISILSSIPYVVMVIIFTLISTYFFTKRITTPEFNIFSSLSSDKTEKLLVIFNHSKKMLANYVMSYGIVILITFLITLVGFLILKVNYAVILSILCALFDLLPVLGMPMIYFPLIIFYFFSNNVFKAIALAILYAIVFITRQIVEPKIVSSSLGLDPVAVLAAIFIGLKAKGVSGMFFCMFLVVFYNILKKVNVL